MIDNDQMRKQGRFGKLIAEHRKKFVVAAMILMALGALPVLWFLLGVLLIPFRTVAAGLSYFKDPLQVTLPNGIIVHEVHQPVMAVAKPSQAALVMNDVKAKRSDRQMITEEAVRQGYLQWRMTSGGGLSNFTLDAMRPLLLKEASSLTLATCPCICYVNFGIAENIVYNVASSEIMYEPKVVTESTANSTEKVEMCQGAATVLIRTAVASQAWLPASLFGTPNSDRFAQSGAVHYITHSGKLKQSVFKQPMLACVKECISYFE